MPSKPHGIKVFFKPVAKVPEKRPRPVDEPDDTIRVASIRTSVAPQVEPSSSPLSSLRSSAIPSSPRGKPPPGPDSPVSISIRSPKPKLPHTATPTPTSPLRRKVNGRSLGSVPEQHKAEHVEEDSCDPGMRAEPSTQKPLKQERAVIQDSDGDSNSLSSLDDLLGRREPDTSSSPPEAMLKPASLKNSAREPSHSLGSHLGRRSRNSHNDRDFAPSKYKFSLESLVAGTVDDDELEAGVTKAREGFDALDAASRQKNDTTSLRGRVGEETIASVFDDDPETGNQRTRLMNALDRTEALSQDLGWSFFESNCLVNHKRPTPFPNHLVDGGTWEDQLREPRPRSRAFLSGYVGEAWAPRDLPDELLSWILDTITFESRDDLRYGYCTMLESAFATRNPSSIQPKHITKIFQAIGARPEALNIKAVVVPIEDRVKEEKTPDWRYLLSSLDLFTALSHSLDFSVRELLTVLVCRMTLDARLMNNVTVSARVEKSICRLLNAVDGSSAKDSMHRIGSNLLNTVKNPQLQAKLLKHIMPYGNCAPFRLRLATAFLLDVGTGLQNPLDPSINLDRLSTHLQDPRFRIETHKLKRTLQDFDYTQLAALTAILDVAIDNGRSVPTFPSHDAERSFNAQVDVLADRIKVIFTAIEDKGAQHMRRTEAKERLETLYYRVMYSVRTRPPPKKKVFGGSGEEWEGVGRSEALMGKFLAGRKQKQKDQRALKRQLGVGSSPVELEGASQSSGGI